MCIIFERKGFWVKRLTNFAVAPAQRPRVEAVGRCCFLCLEDSSGTRGRKLEKVVVSAEDGLSVVKV